MKIDIGQAVVLLYEHVPIIVQQIQLGAAIVPNLVTKSMLYFMNFEAMDIKPPSPPPPLFDEPPPPPLICCFMYNWNAIFAAD